MFEVLCIGTVQFYPIFPSAMYIILPHVLLSNVFLIFNLLFLKMLVKKNLVDNYIFTQSFWTCQSVNYEESITQRYSLQSTEAATRGVLWNLVLWKSEVFLEISQNSQESTSARVSFFNLKRDSDPGVFLWILWNF